MFSFFCKRVLVNVEAFRNGIPLICFLVLDPPLSPDDERVKANQQIICAPNLCKHILHQRSCSQMPRSLNVVGLQTKSTSIFVEPIFVNAAVLVLTTCASLKAFNPIPKHGPRIQNVLLRDCSSDYGDTRTLQVGEPFFMLIDVNDRHLNLLYFHLEFIYL